MIYLPKHLPALGGAGCPCTPKWISLEMPGERANAVPQWAHNGVLSCHPGQGTLGHCLGQGEQQQLQREALSSQAASALLTVPPCPVLGSHVPSPEPVILVTVTWEVTRLQGDSWLLLSLRDAVAQSSELRSLGFARFSPRGCGAGRSPGVTLHGPPATVTWPP